MTSASISLLRPKAMSRSFFLHKAASDLFHQHAQQPCTVRELAHVVGPRFLGLFKCWCSLSRIIVPNKMIVSFPFRSDSDR